MDGLRGYAALQVVALHYCSAFIPPLAYISTGLSAYPWGLPLARTPFFFLLNGYAAVWLFFILSGAVLTGAFGSAPLALLPSVARRIVRLGLPMIGCIILGAIFYSIWPHAHEAAAQFTHSNGWLNAIAPIITLPDILHQIIFEGLFFGYQNYSVFPATWLQALGIHLHNVNQSFAAPLWSLHIEFIGSLLILGLTAIKELVGSRVHIAIALLVLVLLFPTPLSLFVVGHLAWPLTQREARKDYLRYIGFFLIFEGIILCGGAVFPGMNEAFGFFAKFHNLDSGSPLSVQFMVAEISLFFGACLVPDVQFFLSRSFSQTLGKLSFPIYLVHFPILFTLTSWLFLCFFPHMGYVGAVVLAAAIGLGVTFLLAIAFEKWVDQPAIRLSHHVARFVRASLERMPDLSPWYALALYLLLSLVFFGHLSGWTTKYFGDYTDPISFIWFLNWWPYALTHGLNPFISHYVWFPHGYDLAWSTSIPLLALLTMPVTLIGGPVLSFNLLTIIAPALSAWTAFFLARYLTRNRAAALIGGYLFGFSSYEIGQILAHPNLDFVCLVPLAVLLCVRYLRGDLGRRRFILWATLLLLAELGISLEILATLCVFGALAWGIFWLRATPTDRPRFGALAIDIIVSFGLMLILASPYVVYLIKGAGDVPPSLNSTTSFSADLLNYIIPTWCTHLGWGIFYVALTSHFSGDVYEQGAYLGLPLILLMGLYFWDHLTRPSVQALLAVTCALVVLSLGPWLHISGTRTNIPLPWLLIEHLPLIHSALPTRLTMYVALCAAIITALYLAEPTRWRTGRFALAGLACLCLVPNTPLYNATPWPKVAFFTPRNIHQALGPHPHVLILPFGQQSPGMAWQLDAGMGFTQYGGYVGTTPVNESAWPILAYLSHNVAGPDFADNLRAFCATHHVDYILIGPGTVPALIKAVEALNWPQRMEQGVAVITVPPAAAIHYNYYMLGDYWPSGGDFSWMGRKISIITHDAPAILTITGKYRSISAPVAITISDKSDKLVYHVVQSTTQNIWLPPDTTITVAASDTFDIDYGGPKSVSVAIALRATKPDAH